MSDGMFTQSNVSTRWDQYLAVQLALKRYPRDTRLSQLNEVLHIKGELGEGVYGVVYDALISGRRETHYQVAIKSISTVDRPNNRELIFAQMLREEIAYAYLNALVFLRVCPNFALVHRSFLSRHQRKHNMYCFLLSMEKADGNLREWSTGRHVKDPYTFMCCTLQIFMGILAFTMHLNLVHNDLYLKNILYNRITKTTFIYHFRNHTYVLPQCSYLVKISDFGICSSPSFLQNSHDDMKHMTEESRTASSLLNFDFAKHILEYNDVQSFARDSTVVLRSLLRVDTHRSCKRWVHNALKYLDNHRPEEAEDVASFITYIFRPTFLEHSGLSANMFSNNGVTSDTSAEVFQVDTSEQSKRSMMFIAKDYIDAGRSPTHGPTTPATSATPSTLF